MLHVDSGSGWCCFCLSTPYTVHKERRSPCHTLYLSLSPWASRFGLSIDFSAESRFAEKRGGPSTTPDPLLSHLPNAHTALARPAPSTRSSRVCGPGRRGTAIVIERRLNTLPITWPSTTHSTTSPHLRFPAAKTFNGSCVSIRRGAGAVIGIVDWVTEGWRLIVNPSNVVVYLIFLYGKMRKFSGWAVTSAGGLESPINLNTPKTVKR